MKSWHLAHTVIRSNRRFTYEEVQAILERNREASPEDVALPGEHPEPLPEGAPLEGEFADELVRLNRFAKLLREERFRQGAIGFDRPEVRFEIDEKGHPVSTYVKIAKDANKLVEEFMLLANRTVAAAEFADGINEVSFGSSALNYDAQSGMLRGMGNGSVSIYNVSGQLVSQSRMADGQMPLQLQSGLYIVKFNGANGEASTLKLQVK